MATLTERIKIAKLVLTTNDNSVIEKIKSLILPGVKANEAAVKKYNKEIDEAVKQIRTGKYFTQDEADTLLAEWEKK
jgi:imidazoleglycerol phosphate synthase glutamine amidotransferase subunit HisH